MNAETITAAAIGGAIGVLLNGLFTFWQRKIDMRYKNSELRNQLIRESNERQAIAVGNFIAAYRSIRSGALDAMATWALTKWESDKEKEISRFRQEHENVALLSAAFDVLRLAIVHPKMQPVVEKLQGRIEIFDDDLLKVIEGENVFEKWVPLGAIEKDVVQLLEAANKHLVYNPSVDPFPGLFVK
ncbi:hypothetical protein [Corynebacterium glutamicum]|uniref:hypothetical protein n=1 Tax=Corynebacterium glutamicum TaxID=1718 RepID=UPI00074491D1|nr:hypothetical protein [Corynebacterium glutamicum]AMA00213.1 hypothetical protein APT58_08235 [Corynebacterium glutamicum]